MWLRFLKSVSDGALYAASSSGEVTVLLLDTPESGVWIAS